MIGMLVPMYQRSIVIAIALIAACTPAKHRKLEAGRQMAQITLTTGNNNDVTVAGGSPTTYYRFLVNASGSTLTGIDASFFEDGSQIVIRNDATTGNLTITNADTASVAANRFLTPGAVSLILPPKASASLEYDKTATRWLFTSATPSNPTFVGATTFSSTLTAGSAAVFNSTLEAGSAATFDTTITATGHIKTAGTAPTLSSCGSGPGPSVVTGNDVAGTYTTGGTATACTLTFASTYTTAPTCLIRAEGTATSPVYSTTATTIAVATDIPSTVYHFACWGH